MAEASQADDRCGQVNWASTSNLTKKRLRKISRGVIGAAHGATPINAPTLAEQVGSPWPMAKIERDVRPNQVIFDYPTMSEDELRAFREPLNRGAATRRAMSDASVPTLAEQIGSQDRRDYAKGGGEALCEKAGLDYGTVRNCGAVARAYAQLSLRNDNLSFEHHRQAMAAPESERHPWLERTARE